MFSKKLNRKYITAKAKHTDSKGNETLTDFLIAVDGERIKNIPEEQIKVELGEILRKVAISPVSGIYRSFVAFGHAEPEDINKFQEDFNYANVLVEANLPYCIHIPNGYEIEVTTSIGKKALVMFEKIWTNNAYSDGFGSDQFDVVEKDRVTYYQTSTILTPKYPINPELGWEQHFTGRNIEKMKEQNGTFRYTRVYIQLQSDINHANLDQKKGEEALDQITNEALGVVNQIIDCYRYATGQSHIERIGSLNVNMIFFVKENKGFYRMALGPGIETAVINRSQKELEKFEKMLNRGEQPPLYKLLILDSHSALERRSYTLAIVTSFQALEIMLENYLISEYENKGITKKEYEAKMDMKWKTKERLNGLLKEVKEHQLNENRELWEKWHTHYDKTRNEVIHQGKIPTQEETTSALQANEAVINWLLSLKN